jgi:general secretion pathway protein K
MPASGQQTPGKAQRGFVLLVVLATLGLLSVVVVTFTQVSRTHVRVAATSGESARAEALADAGVNIAILDLVAARGREPHNSRFSFDATPHACRVGNEGVLAISIQDEAGKVDLNVGSEQVIRALILGLGGGEAAVDAVLDYRDEDDRRRASGAEAEEYRAARRAAGPKNGPFLAIEELANVLGLTQADAERMRPFVTIHSGQQGIDTSVAPKFLLDIVKRGVERGGTSTFGDRGSDDADAEIENRVGPPLPAQLLAASTRRAFSVRSEARTPAGAIFVREAIVEFLVPNAATFVLRRWHRGAASGFAPGEAILPAC